MRRWMSRWMSRWVNVAQRVQRLQSCAWQGRFAVAWMLSMVLAPTTHAGITTPQILAQTITAMPSCVSYQVKGVCFFLKCGITGCYIRTSIRVSHYVPDVIVSTYNEALLHPWVELGAPIAATTSALGSAMMGLPVDASGNSERETQEASTFKSVDAIGNPAGMITQILAGGSVFASLPATYPMPGFSELLAFPAQEVPQLPARWAAVPAGLSNNVLAGAAQLAKAPGKIVDQIMALPGKLANLQSSIGNVGSIMSNGLAGLDIASQAASVMGIDLGPLQQVASIASLASGISPTGALFCPGSSTPFYLHYQSDLDAYFWREVIPAELLYPDSWVPGINEVSRSPLLNTWGGVYPRTGHLVQSHPVKASAVYAARVGSIITQKAQPHIYTRLQPGSGFKYFKEFSDTRWQMLYPSSTGCVQFGSNDSLSLTSFGDGKTSTSNGYVWNMWNKYDCCQRRGSFLFSVP